MFLRYKLGYLIAGFLSGIVVAVITPMLMRALGRSVLPGGREEIARVTSPDGMVDAVMVEENCGALCSYTYSVSVVPKGEKGSDGAARSVLVAEDMAAERVYWKQPHLLEITYAHALIRNFCNVCYPFAKSGVKGSWGYVVEARLAPTSPEFSYLPKGNGK